MSGTPRQSAGAHWQKIASGATDTEILTAAVAAGGAIILQPVSLIGAAAYDLKRNVLADGSVEVYATEAGTEKRVEPRRGMARESVAPFPARTDPRPPAEAVTGRNQPDAKTG